MIHWALDFLYPTTIDDSEVITYLPWRIRLRNSTSPLSPNPKHLAVPLKAFKAKTPKGVKLKTRPVAGNQQPTTVG